MFVKILWEYFLELFLFILSFKIFLVLDVTKLKNFLVKKKFSSHELIG